MEPAHLREDLKQEVFLALCNSDPNKIIELKQKNQLGYYTVRIILRTIHSSDNSFYYKYRKFLDSSVPLSDNHINKAEEPFDEVMFQNVVNLVYANMDSLTDYERGIFKLYMENDMNCYAVERDFKQQMNGVCIPRKSIHNTVVAVKAKLKCNL